MAGIRLLEQSEVNVNYIAKNLMRPDIKRTLFDDYLGFNEIRAILFSPFTEIYGLFEKGIPLPFGAVMFLNVVPYRSAEVMAAVFEKEKRQQGKLTSVIEKIKQDLVGRYQIRSCSANIIGKNEASEKMMDKLGFKKIGVKKKFYYINGKYVDLNLYYSLLEDKNG